MKMRLLLACLAVFGSQGVLAQDDAPAADAAASSSEAAAPADAATPTDPAAAPAAAPVDVAPPAEPAHAAADAHGHAAPAGGDAKAGELKAAACAACHSVDGNSIDPQYPKIAGQHELYTARQLALFKSGQRENPVMLGFAAALSEQDMRDIGAYFATQKAKADVVDPEQAVVGQALYRGGDAKRGIPACTACHGPAGGGVPGPSYPALAGQHSEYTEVQLKRFREGTVYGSAENINAGVMAGVAKQLTDAEIAAVAAYIEGLYHE